MPPTLERLAAALVAAAVLGSAEVVREGEDGDRFYGIGQGRLTCIRAAVSSGGSARAKCSRDGAASDQATLCGGPSDRSRR